MTVLLDKEFKDSLAQVDFSDLLELPKLVENGNKIEFTFNDNDLLDVKLDINSAISLIGMDDLQNNVNDLGKKLYQIYDELMYQTKAL